MFKSKNFEAENLETSMRFFLSYRKNWIQIIGILFSIIVVLIMFVIIFLYVQISPQTIIYSENLNSIMSLNVGILLLAGISFLLTWLGLLIELLWLLKGKEIIEVADEYISIRHQILGLGFSKKIDAAKIDCVFVSSQKLDLMDDILSSRRSKFLNFQRGKVAINSGKTFWGSIRTFRFGSILDDVETRQIVATIHRRFPQYKRVNSRSA